MPQDPAVPQTKPIHVDVYAFEVKGIGILFAQVWDFVGETHKKKGRIEIEKDQKDVPIEFQLHVESGPDLTFRTVDSKKVEGPFWCDALDCPTVWGDGGGQFKNFVVSGAGKVLTVVDANGGMPWTYHFALRFEDAKSNLYVFDPDIRNGGGGYI